MRTLIAIAATLAFASASFAATGSGTATTTVARTYGSDCTFIRGVTDFSPLDQTRLIVWAPGKRAYLVELGMPLFDLKFAHRLAFIDSNNDGRLCGFGMDRIVVGDASFTQRSTILGMSRVDDAQLVTLEQQYNVQLLKKSRAPKHPPVE